MPWVVSVDLEAVARRLSKSTTHFHDDLEALQHLSAPHKNTPSPLRQTMVLGDFYTEVEPELLLESTDIIMVRWVPPTRKPHLLGE